MKLDLTGKNALVCGSSEGIGRATACTLADLGARVTLLARSRENLEKVCAQLPTTRGQSHHILTADLHEPHTAAHIVSQHIQAQGAIHILINNTGGPPPGQAWEALDTDFRKAFEQHLVASQLLVQTLLPGMRQGGYGRIINILSTSVKQPIAGLGVSNTIRAAVANWAKTLANELGPWGITVNNVLPGATQTRRLQAILEAKAKTLHQTLEQVIVAEQSHIPLRRFASPEELAQAVAFLASPAASYITGINLAVDGGRTSCL